MYGVWNENGLYTGSLKEAFQMMLKLGASSSEVETALLEMDKRDHNVSEFGMGLMTTSNPNGYRTFMYSVLLDFEKDNKIKGAGNA